MLSSFTFDGALDSLKVYVKLRLTVKLFELPLRSTNSENSMAIYCFLLFIESIEFTVRLFGCYWADPQ